MTAEYRGIPAHALEPRPQDRPAVSQLCHEVLVEDWEAAGFRERFFPDLWDLESNDMVFVGDRHGSWDYAVPIIFERNGGTSYDDEHFWIKMVNTQEMPSPHPENRLERAVFLRQQLKSVATEAVPIDRLDIRRSIVERVYTRPPEPTPAEIEAQSSLAYTIKALHRLIGTHAIADPISELLDKMRHTPLPSPSGSQVIFSSPWGEGFRLALLYFMPNRAWTANILSEPQMAARLTSDTAANRMLFSMFPKLIPARELPQRLIDLASGTEPRTVTTAKSTSSVIEFNLSPTGEPYL